MVEIWLEYVEVRKAERFFLAVLNRSLVTTRLSFDFVPNKDQSKLVTYTRSLSNRRSLGGERSRKGEKEGDATRKKQQQPQQ